MPSLFSFTAICPFGWLPCPPFILTVVSPSDAFTQMGVRPWRGQWPFMVIAADGRFPRDVKSSRVGNNSPPAGSHELPKSLLQQGGPSVPTSMLTLVTHSVPKREGPRRR